MTIEEALETFVRGFCFTRSYTYPYEWERHGNIWLMRDAERKKPEYRNEEYVALGVEPGELDAFARRHTRGRYFLDVLVPSGESDALTRTGFKALGYRLTATETFMVHSLERIEAFDGPLTIVRLTKWEEAERLNNARRKRTRVLPQHLTADPPPLRQYMALDGEVPVGWAASIIVGSATWCSNVYVEPEYRRQGIARALMSRVLRDDRDAGAKASVLLASHTGAQLYPTLGYEQVGELLMYFPRRA